MDAFSEILSGVKMNGALFFNAEFSAPWGVASVASSKLAPVLAPGAPHLLIYHFVIDGLAFAQIGDGDTVPLVSGDVIVFPHGDAHYLTRRSGIEGVAANGAAHQ